MHLLLHVTELVILAVSTAAWFLIAFVIVAWGIVEFLIWRFGVLGRRKRQLYEIQQEYARLEDKALRSQMNPHFIFNSLNSIKLLVQEKENEKAVHYLTTFTKLLRGLLNHADKNTVTLFSEIETCRMYLELEALRFDDKFYYSVEIEDGLDLRSIEVPALLIQPFIENAIWHGLMPKPDDRQLKVSVRRYGEWICCLIDDNGIGREEARKQQGSRPGHVSKGLQLASERIACMDQLNDTNTTLVIRDKLDAEGEPSGTRVEIKFLQNSKI